MEIKLFNKWDTTNLQIRDLGLQAYVNMRPLIVPHSGARNAGIRFGKRKMHFVERLINKFMVTGHYAGDKHLFTSGRNTGKKALATRIVENALVFVEKKTKKNPVQVLLEAIQNGAPKAEVTSVEFGGIRHPVAVDCAPMRRLDIALGLLAKGAFKKSIKAKESISECLADEIILASNNDPKAMSIERRAIMEKQAESSR
jgi:small subunit ribosomal protein S7